MTHFEGSKNVIREIRKPGRVFVDLCPEMVMPVEVKKTSLLHRLTSTNFSEDETITAYRHDNGDLHVTLTADY